MGEEIRNRPRGVWREEAVAAPGRGSVGKGFRWEGVPLGRGVLSLVMDKPRGLVHELRPP